MTRIPLVWVMVAALFWPAAGMAQGFKIIGPAPYCDATILHGPNERGASSAAPQGRAVILYDPRLMPQLPYLEPFVMAHECAHHALGHTSPEGLLREGFQFQEKELAADCWAARELTARGEADVVAEQIALWDRQDTDRPGPRYPTWAERIDKLRECSGS
ncbi:MAG: hypothetical protein AAGH68_01665 [Pseudomonadota bacterium]